MSTPELKLKMISSRGLKLLFGLKFNFFYQTCSVSNIRKAFYFALFSHEPRQKLREEVSERETFQLSELNENHSTCCKFAILMLNMAHIIL
jgi:hypothetical protein